jgi:hypothetical protein
VYKLVHSIYGAIPLTVFFALQGNTQAETVLLTLPFNETVHTAEKARWYQEPSQKYVVQVAPESVPLQLVHQLNATSSIHSLTSLTDRVVQVAPESVPSQLAQIPSPTPPQPALPSSSIDTPPSPQTETPSSTPPSTELPTPVAPLPDTAAPQFHPISARGGVRYNSSGGGYDGFGQFEGFIPLSQTPRNLTFLEGRLLLDNGAHLGANVLVGYRFYNQPSDRILGAYVSYDHRNTGESSFNQIGLGLEALGKVDLRLNGYLPFGETRNLYRTDILDTTTQVSNPRFQANNLVFDLLQRQTERRFYEAAVSGFDLEAGSKLAALGDTGSLRGYGGLYYYDAKGSDSTLGFRLRLEARPTDYLAIGLGVQRDDLFGTQVLFSIGATFPGSRPSGVNPASTLARLGESVQRTNAIVVDRQRELQVVDTQQTGILARTVGTGQPFQFVPVNDLSSFQQALATAQPNSIVYVQAGIDPGIPGFTIPDNVQVLSSGPQQFINTSIGLVPLPGSGSGIFPNVTSTVTLGNNTVLSGFAINPGGGVGSTAVLAQNVTGFTVRENQITNADSGIDVEAINGTASGTISDNQISNIGTTGVLVGATNGTIPSITVSGNQITNVGISGIEVNPTNNSTVGTVVIANNIITNTASTAFAGIEIDPVVSSSIASVTLSGNIVTNFFSGISFDPFNNSTVANVANFSNTVTGAQVTSYDHTRDSNSRICISRLDSNIVSSPAAGSNDLRFDTPSGGTGTGAYQFVNFSVATVQASNTNFNAITGAGNVSVVANCP